MSLISIIQWLLQWDTADSAFFQDGYTFNWNKVFVEQLFGEYSAFQSHLVPLCFSVNIMSLCIIISMTNDFFVNIQKCSIRCRSAAFNFIMWKEVMYHSLYYASFLLFMISSSSKTVLDIIQIFLFQRHVIIKHFKVIFCLFWAVNCLNKRDCNTDFGYHYTYITNLSYIQLWSLFYLSLLTSFMVSLW